MTIVWPLQAGWVLDPLPPDLPIWLLSLGLEAMFIGAVVKATKQSGLWGELATFQRLFGVFGLAVGYFFSALALLSTSYAAYAAYLFLLFRTLEGAAAVQIYQRVLEFIKKGTVSGNVRSRLRYHLVTVFIAGLGLYLAIKVLTSGPIYRGVWTDLSLIYTIFVSVLTFLAVRWRLRHVTSDYNVGIVSGIALGVAGAQVYGFTLAEDLLVFVGGSICYSFGFWVAAGFLFGSRLFGGSAECSSCNKDLSGYDDPSFCPQCGAKT